MALLEFSMIPLLFSPGTSHLMIVKTPSVRESECIWQKPEEEDEKWPKNQFGMAGIQTHDLSLLSRLLYPLDHVALPRVHQFLLEDGVVHCLWSHILPPTFLFVD